MKKILTILAISVCVSSPVWAAAMPKAESIVTGDRITLGDVFDGVDSQQSSYYLAPAPQPGKELVLDVNDLSRISHALKLGWESSD